MTETEHCVALLGRPDTPTDAVEDYCRYLARALEAQGISLELVRVKWAENGWRASLLEVRKKAKEHPGCWFLVQYTALSWSRRGFPLRLPKLVRCLKNARARCAVVFHDATPYGGSRTIDRVRRMLQRYAMQRTLRLVDLSILTIPVEKAHWIPNGSGNIAFIPVGANLPEPERALLPETCMAREAAAVCVFSISPGFVGKDETELIARAARYASEKTGSLRLVVVGRNSEEAGRQLQQRLSGSLVQLTVHGLLRGEEIVRVLGACQVLLFTRGQISSRRGSAIAGIACGLPVIAERGSETGAPITEAGVVLLPEGAKNEFGPALVRVLKDAAYRESLAERSRQAQERYFSWKVIAEQYVTVLHGPTRNNTKQIES